MCRRQDRAHQCFALYRLLRRTDKIKRQTRTRTSPIPKDTLLLAFTTWLSSTRQPRCCYCCCRSRLLLLLLLLLLLQPTDTAPDHSRNSQLECSASILHRPPTYHTYNIYLPPFLHRQQQHAMQRFSGSYVAALLLTFAAASVHGFSFSRTLHDVEQDVAEDASLYSQEMRVNAPELSVPSSSQRNQLEKYVSIKSSPSSYVNVVRGQRVELKCEVDGSPPPRIYWIKGENPGRQVEQLERESIADVSYTAIAREVSKLIIDCVQPQHQSVIHCVGVSGDKTVISQPTVLNVQGGNGSLAAGGDGCQNSSPSAPVITRHRPLYFSEMESTVELPCEASGSPRPHVRWVDGEDKPLTDPRFTVQPSGNLVISSIRWQDMDGYKCLAKSPQGEAEAVTFLYPAAKSESEKRKANAL